MSLHASRQVIPHRPDDSGAVEGARRATSLNLRVGGIVCPHCPPTVEHALSAPRRHGRVASGHVSRARHQDRARNARCGGPQSRRG